MTPSELKYKVEQSGHETHFFDRKTMRFFGDTMKNYGVSGPITITTNSGETCKAYELFRRKPVKHGLRDSAWFHSEEFRRVYVMRGGPPE